MSRPPLSWGHAAGDFECHDLLSDFHDRAEEQSWQEFQLLLGESGGEATLQEQCDVLLDHFSLELDGEPTLMEDGEGLTKKQEDIGELVQGEFWWASYLVYHEALSEMEMPRPVRPSLGDSVAAVGLAMRYKLFLAGLFIVLLARCWRGEPCRRRGGPRRDFPLYLENTGGGRGHWPPGAIWHHEMPGTGVASR